MLRRALLALLAVKAARAGSLIPENAFAVAYNEWIRLRIEAPPGTLYAPAERQWPVVEKAWNKLKHSVKNA